MKKFGVLNEALPRGGPKSALASPTSLYHHPYAMAVL